MTHYTYEYTQPAKGTDGRYNTTYTSFRFATLEEAQEDAHKTATEDYPLDNLKFYRVEEISA